MKVCIISDIYASYKNRGGVEEQMENTILYLKKNGVEVVYYDYDPQTIINSDIVHFFKSLYWYWPIAEFCVKIGKPYVITPVFYISDFYNRIQYRIISQFKIRGLFKVACILNLWNNAVCLFPNTSAEEKQILSYTNHHRSNIVLNCVSDNFFDAKIDLGQEYIRSLGLQANEYLLNIARIEKRKNQLRLVKAMKEIGMKLVLVGPIGDKKYFSEVMKFKNAVYLGEIWDPSEKITLIKYSRLFVLPSLLETPGISALEAKYYKKNILLTKIGVGEEYFKDYQGIRYVNPLSVRNIKQNLFYLLDNTSLCNDKNQLPRYKDQIKIIVDKYNILLNG